MPSTCDRCDSVTDNPSCSKNRKEKKKKNKVKRENKMKSTVNDLDNKSVSTAIYT